MKNPVEGNLSTVLTATASAVATGIESTLQLAPGTLGHLVLPSIEEFARKLFKERGK